jgi:hypothetical protein
MSSNIWTPDELSSNSRPLSGRCWRLVEAQHHVATAKLTDNRHDQDRLEILLEESKPSIPAECRELNYLLFTPFRYGAPYPRGSRFRRAGVTPGVFYASELPRVAATELAFHRLLFFAESPDTPWPANPGEYTAFVAEYGADRHINLTALPFNQHAAAWTHPTQYEECQKLADGCRAQEIDVIRYQSARFPAQASNIAILRCRAFTRSEITERQTWRIHLSDNGVRIICEFPRDVLDFDRRAFGADPRISEMRWDR